MQLHFESLAELSEFLEFSRTIGAQFNQATVRAGELSVTGPVERILAPALAMTPAELSAEVLRQTANPAEPVSPGMVEQLAELEEAQGNEPAPTGQPEPTKRKRRTKAEMEAARAAETRPVDGSDTMSAEVAAQQSQPETHSANPFEASTNNASAATQAILSAPTGQAATLAGIAAMQTNPFEPAVATASEVCKADPQTSIAQPVHAQNDPVAFIEARSLEILTTAAEPLTAVKHMHVCRDFIAKHGQAKYMESFPLAGLPATVATFKAEQCAKHQAALEFLNV